MAKNIREWAHRCDACQRCKIHWYTKTALGNFPQPQRRFSHIHVDIVGAFPASNEFCYLLTITDRSTALLGSWVSRFGIPEHITSDRGGQFVSKLWSSLARLLGIQLHYTTACHPQANGMIERCHRTLKAALMARCTNSD